MSETSREHINKFNSVLPRPDVEISVHLAAVHSSSPHRQLVVEALQSDHQSVLSGHQLVSQLSHVGLVGRFRQVVSQDVDKEVKEDETERGRTHGEHDGHDKLNSSS